MKYGLKIPEEKTAIPVAVPVICWMDFDTGDEIGISGLMVFRLSVYDEKKEQLAAIFSTESSKNSGVWLESDAVLK